MEPATQKDDKFLGYNRALSILNILIALYILITPFLPGLLFYLKRNFSEPPAYAGKLAETPTDKKPDGNRLVIPALQLDEKVHEGPGEATLRKGVWRRPNGSTPDKGSNTVMAGHVFTYSTPAVFYNLSKLDPGARLAVYWEGKEYLYRVDIKQTVPADAVEVEAPTDFSQLTLYTCTPLWNPVNRLVVTASLQEVTEL